MSEFPAASSEYFQNGRLVPLPKEEPSKELEAVLAKYRADPSDYGWAPILFPPRPPDPSRSLSLPSLPPMPQVNGNFPTRFNVRVPYRSRAEDLRWALINAGCEFTPIAAAMAREISMVKSDMGYLEYIAPTCDEMAAPEDSSVVDISNFVLRNRRFDSCHPQAALEVALAYQGSDLEGSFLFDMNPQWVGSPPTPQKFLLSFHCGKVTIDALPHSRTCRPFPHVRYVFGQQPK